MKIFKIVIFCMVTSLFAQQDGRFTLFNFNGSFINPAVVGSKEQFNATSLYRHQWTKYKGAPHTFITSVDFPIIKIRSAVGVHMMSESIGIVNNNFLSFSYSAIAHLSSYSRLSAGIQMGLNQMKVGFSDIYTDPTNTYLTIDPSLNYGQNLNFVKPHLGVGIYYYDKKYKIGISTPTLNSYDYYGVSLKKTKQSHYYITGGINFRINDMWEYNPRLYFKVTNNAPIQGDFFNQFIYNDKLTLGFTLRTQEAFAGIIGFKFHEQFNVAYAYDAVLLNELRSYQAGSHEIMLNYLIPMHRHDDQLRKLKIQRKHKCVDFDKGGRKKKRFFRDVEEKFYDRN